MYLARSRLLFHFDETEVIDNNLTNLQFQYKFLTPNGHRLGVARKQNQIACPMHIPNRPATPPPPN
jgi:hypothetical protein